MSCLIQMLNNSALRFIEFNPWPKGLGAEQAWPFRHGLNERTWETLH